MITPRVTRLVRVPDLRAMQRVVADLAELASNAQSCRSCAVIVPTRGAAAELRRTIENVFLTQSGRAAVMLPDLLTRADFYARLSERLPGIPPLLSEFEREVLVRLAARGVERAGTPAPFRLRPGLIVGILAFYDELRRSHRTVDDFHRLMTGDLAPHADSDRGAERLLRQAEFLSATFGEFECHIARTGRVDEHGLRALLLERPASPPYEHVIIAVADQAADARGLWMADFDLLARMPGVRRVDVVATERLLAAGFHQRLHERHLPGIEEVRMGAENAGPLLYAPLVAGAGEAAYTYACRDREEELADVARWLKCDEPALERTAVVFQRPLPYLYLARQVFGDAHVPYQAMDALPLAGEPFVAALDLLFAFAIAEGTRAAMVELLGSPHWVFADAESGRQIARADIVALDALLRDLKFLGGWEHLASLAHDSEWHDSRAKGASDLSAKGASHRAALWHRAAPALRAAAAAADELALAVRGPRASVQLDALRGFIARHESLPQPSDAWSGSHLRARAAVLAGLEGLRDAHERHDDEPVPFVELAAAIRRWIEGRTFAPRTGTAGVLLLDAAAATFADIDDLRIVGLVDGDWPERASRSIFFPSKLLEPLGWPSPAERLNGERARFQDLLRLPSRSVAASSFSLEDDAIVAPSAFVDELAVSGLLVERTAADVAARIFDHEALALEPLNRSAASGDVAEWLAFREQLAPADAVQFHGAAGARPPTIYAVSRVERYLECPFKYFAANILDLDEERPEESALTPLERGRFLHAVFEAFFLEWRAAGHGAITSAKLEDALAMFERVAEAHLGTLPESDRALERTYLLGSAVAPGLAERAFAFEIEDGVPVVERLLEFGLEGTFAFRGPGGLREVKLRAKADRIDLLDNGTFRIVDYKIGRAPRPSRSLQLPVYGVCAQQQLAGRGGRQWSLSRAGYVAFREKEAFVPLGGATGNLAKALADGEERLVAAITSIEEGNFPPRPEDPWLCSRCGYALVCRKDYVGDE